jgi:glycosyltransferase involved in cell wall biosynthesis
MRILQIVHSPPLFTQAGTEIYTHNLSVELSKKHKIYIFSRTCNLEQKEYEIKKEAFSGLTVYTINNTFKNCDSFKMLYQNEIIDQKFEEVLREVRPDVVHIQHLNYLSIGLIKKITERRIPIALTFHDYWWMCPRPHLFKKDYRPCDKAIVSKFDQECLSCVNEMLMIRKNFKSIYNCIRRILPTFIVLSFKKIYFSLMGFAYSDNNLISKLQERAHDIKCLMDSINIFIAPTECIRKNYIEFGIPGEKIKLSCHGFNINLFNGLQKNRNHKLRFAFIGTILPAKGPHVLIESFNGIQDKNAQLMIYGNLRSFIGFEHYLPYLKKIIKNKNIMFMDGFDNRQIASIFQKIDVLVVPSLWLENSPLVIQEAFLAKTPVIASRIGGITELVLDGVNGLLCDPGDVHGLQEKIERIIDNPDLIQKFKENMPQVKSIEDNAREMEEIYQEIHER